MEDTKKFSSEDFVKLYSLQIPDEKITPITDAIGFTLVRSYPENSDYSKDDRQMFIKIYLSGDAVCGGIDMVRKGENGGNYTIVSGDKYKRRTTGFFFGSEEKLTFDVNQKKIVHEPDGLSFSISEFVGILIKNHLSDRLFWKRVKDHLANIFLKLLFWFSDKHYERIKVMLDIYRSERNDKPDKSDEKNIEPFFKYFFITKNILFTLLLVTFPLSLLVSYACVFSDYTLSNPSIVLMFFLILFILEKISIWLDKKIKMFFGKDNNFIYKLHNYLYDSHFNLKLK